MKKKGLVIPVNCMAAISQLSDEKIGLLVKALMCNHMKQDVDVMALEESVRCLYLVLSAYAQEAGDEYDAKCERNRQRAQQRWAAMKPQESEKQVDQRGSEEDVGEKSKEQVVTSSKVAQDEVKSSAVSESFEEFWKQYPRKIDKKRARKRFDEICRKVDVAVILQGLKEYLAYIAREKLDLKFVKHPTSWLNGACWENEYGGDVAMPEVVCERSETIAQLEKEFNEKYVG